MRRLDIGIASYGASRKLERTLKSIQSSSTTDWRCFVIDNPGPDPTVREMIVGLSRIDGRIVPVFLEENVGYAGAVARLQEMAETEYIAYCDNDVILKTRGWDELLAGYLDRFHEIGLMFPAGGAYPIARGPYTEIMWGIGCCWMLNRLAMSEVGPFDTSLGHQEEADYCLRVRMAGYKCASAPEVHIHHDASATNSPQSNERIARGVRNFVDKWNRYFNGRNFHYHHPRVTRWEDWPPNALYLEEYWKLKMPGLNAHPEQVSIDGQAYDLLKVPRLAGFYTGRII